MDVTKSTNLEGKFEEAIKKIRAEKHIRRTQAFHYLAKKLGYTPQQFYNWKRGELPSDVDAVILAIERVIADVSNGLPTSLEREIAPGLSPKEKDIYIMYGELQGRVKRLEDIVEELLERDRLIGAMYRLRK